MFRVQKTQCETCIYKTFSAEHLKELENAVRDPHLGFKAHRICHRSDDVCCRGFWDKAKDLFPLGQIAQRFGMVEFVEVDTQRDAQKKTRKSRR